MVAALCVCVGLCNRFSASSPPGCGRILVISFKRRCRGGGGGLTYNKVEGKRNKCMAFDKSMTGSDWLDWEMGDESMIRCWT